MKRMHGKDMTQVQLMEKLELNETETIYTVTEWLSSVLQKVEPPLSVSCPCCDAEVLI